MSLHQVLVLAILFCAVFALSMLGLRHMAEARLHQRLKSLQPLEAAGSLSPPAENSLLTRLFRMARPLAKLSLPKENWEKTPLRLQFLRAGFRGDAAPTVYFGMKSLLLIVMPFLAWLLLMGLGGLGGLGETGEMGGDLELLCIVCAGAGGFYLPNAVLQYRVRKRKREVEEVFPDALDLMTVCVESGLAMDASILRVAEEIAFTAPVLSEEFRLVNLELRAGSGKEKALRNFALRTGADETDTFVTILIQAERFGTGIGAALRVHSDTLRVRRRQRAEETAAKVGLKLLFPLVFCIFPSLLVVLLGPAMLQLFRSVLPSLGG